MANFLEKISLSTCRLLRVFLGMVMLFGVFATSNSFARTNYYCNIKYTGCNSGYYLSDCGSYRDGRTVTGTAGNSCNSCPGGYTCSGSNVCPTVACIPVTLRKTNQLDYGGVDFPGWTNKTIYYRADTGYFYSDSNCNNRQTSAGIKPSATGYSFSYWQRTVDSDDYAWQVINTEETYAVLANDDGNEHATLVASNYILEPYWTCASGYTDNGNGVCTAQSVTCPAGKYLPANSGTCSNCPAGKYCAGGTLTRSSTDQGITGDITAGYFCAGGGKTATPSSSSDSVSGSSCGKCTDNGASGTSLRPTYSNAGAASCTACPDVASAYTSRLATAYFSTNLYWGYWANDIHNTVEGCAVHFIDNDADGEYIISWYHRGGTSYHDSSWCELYGNWDVKSCVAGKYNSFATTYANAPVHTLINTADAGAYTTGIVRRAQQPKRPVSKVHTVPPVRVHVRHVRLVRKTVDPAIHRVLRHVRRLQIVQLGKHQYGTVLITQ